MNTTTKQPPDTCRITIVNEVTGEHTSKVSPQSLSECMDVDGDVLLAKEFIEFQQLRDKKDKFVPLGCCIFKSHARGIVVYWHATDNIDMARDAWEEAQENDWRAT